MLEAMIRACDEIFPEAIFAVHLDHGDEKTCYDCIDSGFYSSVMIDASHDPFEENVAITKRVVERAHAKGISVEAELGMLGGVEEDIAVDEKNALLTDPQEAKEFVAANRLRQPGLRHRHQSTARTNSPAARACTSTASRPFKPNCRASRWSCTARPRCRRMKFGASTQRAAS